MPRHAEHQIANPPESTESQFAFAPTPKANADVPERDESCGGEELSGLSPYRMLSLVIIECLFIHILEIILSVDDSGTNQSDYVSGCEDDLVDDLFLRGKAQNSMDLFPTSLSGLCS